MGKNQWKEAESHPEGPIVDDMREKYGPECFIMLNDWIRNYGFPAGGSLSLDQLKKLENKLKEEEEKLMRKKALKGSDMKVVNDNQKCLTCWKNEAESTERKQLQKETTKMKVEDRNDSKGSEIDNTHTHTHTTASASFSHRAEGTSPGPAHLPHLPSSLLRSRIMPCNTRPAPPNFLRSQPVLHWGSQRPP